MTTEKTSSPRRSGADWFGLIAFAVLVICSAVLVVRLQQAFAWKGLLVSVGVTALISGLTSGGKALGKNYAIRNSTGVVFTVAKILHIFHRR